MITVSLANIAVHYILQTTANMLIETEIFHRFLGDIIWISASERSNEHIQQALTSPLANSGLELRFHKLAQPNKQVKWNS